MTKEHAEEINKFTQSIVSLAHDIDPDAADFDVDDTFDSLDLIREDLKKVESILEDYIK